MNHRSAEPEAPREIDNGRIKRALQRTRTTHNRTHQCAERKTKAKYHPWLITWLEDAVELWSPVCAVWEAAVAVACACIMRTVESSVIKARRNRPQLRTSLISGAERATKARKHKLLITWLEDAAELSYAV